MNVFDCLRAHILRGQRRGESERESEHESENESQNQSQSQSQSQGQSQSESEMLCVTSRSASALKACQCMRPTGRWFQTD